MQKSDQQLNNTNQVTNKKTVQSGKVRTVTTYYHPTIELCKECKGSGKIMEYEKYDLLRMNGKEKVCSLCGGSGRLLIEKKLETKISPYQEGGAI